MINDFYEIRSKKSSELINGIYQTSLICSNNPDIKCFVWSDTQGNIKHIQILFEENLIEWFDKKGVTINCTNRHSQQINSIGVLKGVRTIHQTRDEGALKKGLELIAASNFPPKFDHRIKSKFIDIPQKKLADL